MPTATPLFASDAEALAAATAAYAAYQRSLDHAFATYDIADLALVASNPALAAAKGSVEKYRSESRKQLGVSVVDTVSLVDPSSVTGASADEPLQIYACLDVSNTDVRDGNDVSILPPGRTQRFPIVASLVWNKIHHSLVVQQEEEWTGANFC